MKIFARFFALALALVLVAATSAEAQRGPGGGGPGRGHGGGMGPGPRPGGPGPGHGGGMGPGRGGPGRGGMQPGHGGPGRGFPGRGPVRGGYPRTVPFPYPTYPGYCGVFDDCYGRGGYGGGYGGGSVGGEIACAPEVVEGNVKATERTLKTLAASSDFASASTFKKEIARISAMKDTSSKTAQYFAMAGIDPQDSAAVVEFIGARDAKGAWLNDLERNTDLTSAQAEVVAVALQNALRGGLQ